MARARRWPHRLAGGMAGLAMGAGSFAAAALLLYGAEGFLRAVGFLIAVALAATAAGVWVGASWRPAPTPGRHHRRVLGRWMFAVGALILASFVATFWIRSPEIQGTVWAAPVALVLLLAEPLYALGMLVSGLQEWGRGGVAVPALAGAALGAALAGAWLIPAFPPGLVFLGLALALTAAGSLEMGFSRERRQRTMADRVVIVTGLGDVGQVGYAVAEAFVRQGARVVVTSRDESVRERARGLGGSVVAVPADLADPAGADAVVEAARSRWGRLDVLVNVAGGLRVTKPVAGTSPEEWRREVESNATTAFLMSRAALPLLRESRGAIINFASPAGLRAVGGMAAYSAGKAGVVALTRALAKEEKSAGVRVNAVAPGMIDTAQNRASVEDPATVTWVTREQVVDVVLFLASEPGSGVNGETVAVVGNRV